MEVANTRNVTKTRLSQGNHANQALILTVAAILVQQIFKMHFRCSWFPELEIEHCFYLKNKQNKTTHTIIHTLHAKL